jgi:hypothetical protein
VDGEDHLVARCLCQSRVEISSRSGRGDGFVLSRHILLHFDSPPSLVQVVGLGRRVGDTVGSAAIEGAAAVGGHWRRREWETESW